MFGGLTDVFCWTRGLKSNNWGGGFMVVRNQIFPHGLGSAQKKLGGRVYAMCSLLSNIIKHGNLSMFDNGIYMYM